MLDKRAAKITLGYQPIRLEFVMCLDGLPRPSRRRKLAGAVCKDIPPAINAKCSNNNPNSICGLIVHAARATRVDRHDHTLHPRQCHRPASYVYGLSRPKRARNIVEDFRVELLPT
jgi:hypothetical protein